MRTLQAADPTAVSNILNADIALIHETMQSAHALDRKQE